MGQERRENIEPKCCPEIGGIIDAHRLDTIPKNWLGIPLRARVGENLEKKN